MKHRQRNDWEERPASVPPWYDSCLPEWGAIWAACARRLHRWRPPPRWSVGDWWEEVEALGLAAAWEAVCDYDPAREVARDAFVLGRVLARVLALYRREWAYGRHCDPEAQAIRGGEGAVKPKSAAPIVGDWDDWVDRLAEADRLLIEHLFVDGWTEARAARELGISQPAVSKRKRAILAYLRRANGVERKDDNSEYWWL